LYISTSFKPSSANEIIQISQSTYSIMNAPTNPDIAMLHICQKEKKYLQMWKNGYI